MRSSGSKTAKLPVALCLLIATALVGVVFAAPASARRLVPARFVGINWNPPTLDSQQNDEFAGMASAGAESVRVSFDWATAQPTPGAPYYFGATDWTVELAAAHHLPVLPIVERAPDWAAEGGRDWAPPNNPGQFAAYLTALIQRYGPHGSFWAQNPELPRVPIREWQIWNEPNAPTFWRTGGADWAQKYVTLLKAAQPAVKRADSGATVVLGSLTNSSWTDLTHLYGAGARRYFDVTALDPYTTTPKKVVEINRLVRRVMRKHGDRHKPIWVTEVTLPAAKGRVNSNSVFQTSDAGMASFLTGVYSQLAKQRRKLGVQRVYWYTWLTSYDSSQDPWVYSGLNAWTGESTAPEPAFQSFLSVARHLEGCTKTVAATCQG